MRASSKRPRVESSSDVASPLPPSSSDPTTDAYVDLTAAVDPPPSTSDDSSIRRMLDTVMTVQAAHCQLLLDGASSFACKFGDILKVTSATSF